MSQFKVTQHYILTQNSVMGPTRKLYVIREITLKRHFLSAYINSSF